MNLRPEFVGIPIRTENVTCSEASDTQLSFAAQSLRPYALHNLTGSFAQSIYRPD